MRMFLSRLVSLALMITPIAAFTASPAQAQQRTGRVVCVAESPSAYGYGTNFNGTLACQRALVECSLRTPEYQTCYVTRWYWETL
jgi:hypothetical protein